MSLGFIGGGNMAAAMIGGLQRRAPRPSIHVVERDGGRRQQLCAQFGVTASEQIDAALGACSVVVLAVKPGDLRGVCEALAALPGATRPLLLSIAAGIPSTAIARWSANPAVVRAMPNTPALVARGITGAYARPAVQEPQRAAARQVLEAIGDVAWFEDEGMLDAVTAISGSGPAYVFYFMEALQAAAARMGMDGAQARHFAVQTVAGAAALAAQAPEDLATLRARVTSKGGTTAAALASMERDGVGPAIIAGAFAALERSRELGQAAGQ